MSTQFRALLAAASDSHLDLRDPWNAAAYLDVSDDLVRFWRDGYGEPPIEVVERLRARVAELAGDGDFYEDDEPVGKITEILARGYDGVTAPPDEAAGPPLLTKRED